MGGLVERTNGILEQKLGKWKEATGRSLNGENRTPLSCPLHSKDSVLSKLLDTVQLDSSDNIL
ncbi:15539_t:CDS:2, partial [Racocetra fulgida]